MSLMKTPISLNKLLTISISVIITIVAVAYSLALGFIIHSVENQLMGSSLSSELSAILTHDIDKGRPPRLDQFSKFYVEGDPVYPIPNSLQNLPLGYQEFLDGEELHVYSSTHNGKRVVLTKNQELFEAWERGVAVKSIISVLLITILSVFFSHWLSSKLLKPLKDLSNQAKNTDVSLANGLTYSTQPFQVDKTNIEEFRILTNTLNELTLRLYNMIVQERMFSSEVSHEIRTPLTVIDTSLELLSDKLQNDAKAQQWLARANSASRGIRNIMEVFLNLTRQNVKQSILGTTLTDLLKTKEEDWNRLAKEKGLKFRIDYFSSPQTQYNVVLANTVIENIINNAFRFTNKGQIVLTLQRDAIKIQDTGIGIKKEEYEKVFKVGYQVRQGSPYGFGLGLAIAKRSAEALGWFIDLKSGTSGTIITILLEAKANDKKDTAFS